MWEECSWNWYYDHKDDYKHLEPEVWEEEQKEYINGTSNTSISLFFWD